MSVGSEGDVSRCRRKVPGRAYREGHVQLLAAQNSIPIIEKIKRIFQVLLARNFQAWPVLVMGEA